MSSENTERQVKEIIVSSLRLDDVRPEAIASDAPLFGEGLGLDSIDALELATALEGHFGVKFAPASMDSRAVFRTVASLASFIDSSLAMSQRGGV
jgi:acyl carrier protein